MEYDFFDEPSDNEHEITIEEFQNIAFREEFEIDLDDFTDYLLKREEEQIIEDEYRSRMDDRAVSMNELLEHGRYFEAFSDSEKLRRRAYADYKDEIERCLEIYVKNDVPDALIHMTHKHIDPNLLKIEPEGFIYLKKLSDMGYIESFRWLADCYYHGWGCDKEPEAAKKLYFEGMIFGGNNYCRQRYGELFNENDYAGNELIRRVITKAIESKDTMDERITARIAVFIQDGKIKGYGNKAVYVLLKSSYNCSGSVGLVEYKLAECLLYGIGVDPNPVVAKYLLDVTLMDLEWNVNDFDDPWVREQIEETYFEYADFIEAYNKAKEMLEDASEKVKWSEKSGFMEYDFMDENEIIENWTKKKELFIDRVL